MSKEPNNRLIHDDPEPEPQRVMTPAPAAAAAERPLPRVARSRVGGRGGPYQNRRQVTAHIDKKLFLWLKTISAQTEKPMVELFEEALNAYVASYAAQSKFGKS